MPRAVNRLEENLSCVEWALARGNEKDTFWGIIAKMRTQRERCSQKAKEAALIWDPWVQPAPGPSALSQSRQWFSKVAFREGMFLISWPSQGPALSFLFICSFFLPPRYTQIIQNFPFITEPP